MDDYKHDREWVHTESTDELGVDTSPGKLLNRTTETSDFIQKTLRLLQSGTRIQRHSAAKMLKYMHTSGFMTAYQRNQVSDEIKRILSHETDTEPGVIMAMLEALYHVDIDSFWSRVIEAFVFYIEHRNETSED